jgi:hypothetical protein
VITPLLQFSVPQLITVDNGLDGARKCRAYEFGRVPLLVNWKVIRAFWRANRRQSARSIYDDYRGSRDVVRSRFQSVLLMSR